MITVHDTISGDVLEYEDIEEFRATGKYAFDDSVHSVIDELCDEYKTGGDHVWELERFLGIEIFQQ